MTEKTTHFGYQQVKWDEKQRRVAGVFDSVADNYDLMNDVMSLGIHRLWKRFAIEQSGARPGQRILDLAGGTGDLAARLSRMVGPQGEVVIGDINASMLNVGRARLLDRGISGNVRFVQANAETLPFPHHHRFWLAQRNGQAEGAGGHVPGAETRGACAGAGIFQTGAAGIEDRL